MLDTRGKAFVQGILDAVPLGDDLSIVELHTPEPFVGKTLIDLALPRRYGVTVAAIRRPGEAGSRLEPPSVDRPLSAEDVLVIVAPESEIERLVERNER